MNNELKEKASFFSIVGYGLHSKINNWLKEFFGREFETKSVSFYEYFLTEARIRGKRDETTCGYAPFLLRILSEREFVPILGSAIRATKWEEISLTVSSFAALKDFWAYNNIKGIKFSDSNNTMILKEVLESWEGKKDLIGNNFWLGYDDDKGIVSGEFRFPLDYFRNEYLVRIQSYPEEDQIFLLQEYSLIILPWLNCKDIDSLNISVFSISSKNLFLGELLIFYPDISNPRFPGGIFHNQVFIEKIEEIVQNLYVPILLLYENCWAEKLSQKEMESLPIKWDKNFFLNGGLSHSIEPLERAFYELWSERKRIWESFIPMEEATKRVKQSIQFGKYIIASPGLLTEFKRIAFPRDPVIERRYLPSLLVIGEAGSGKDTMANICQLFSLSIGLAKGTSSIWLR